MPTLPGIFAGSGSVVGVDSLEKKEETKLKADPMSLQIHSLRDYPLIGEARGKDDPEKDH